jgi:hypothetical protein
MKTADLLPYLLAETPAVPDVTAKQALTLAAIEFCRETLLWDELQDPITVIDKVHTYDLEAPTDAGIVAVKQVWAADRELVPVVLAKLVQVMPNWQTAQGSDPVYYNTAADWSTVRIFPTPMNANRQKLVLRVIYQPTVTSTTLPDFLVNNYLEALLSGAKARLMAMPQKAWTNNDLAAYHKGLFDAAIIQARIDSIHERSPGTVTVRPRRFGF